MPHFIMQRGEYYLLKVRNGSALESKDSKII